MAPRTKISFATFNLYNLNLPDKPMYRDSEGWTQQEYDAKVDWAAHILKTFKSRVWGFQELWHEDALKDVFQKAGLHNNYDLLTPKDHTGKRIVCGAAVEKGLLVGEPEWLVSFHPKFILSAGGDDEQTSKISVRVTKFSRPVLKFKIRPRSNGRPITVFVAHLKSKRPATVYYEGWYREDADFYRKHSEALGYTISTIRRSVEAAALRMYIVEDIKDKDDPLVVLGDLNDGQLSNTLNILTGQPNYLISGFSEGGSDVDLYTVATLMEYRSLRDVYYTHIYQNTKESLDHILVSQEFYDNSRKRIWAFDGMIVHNDHLHDEEHNSTGTTDHGIVKSTFEYRPV